MTNDRDQWADLQRRVKAQRAELRRLNRTLRCSQLIAEARMYEVLWLRGVAVDRAISESPGAVWFVREVGELRERWRKQREAHS